MKSILSEIQDSVEKYADIISKISGVEVEVMDNNYIRIAGTGFFADKVNQDMSDESTIYQQALTCGKRQIVYNPRKDKICEKCKHIDKCEETFEISMPIKLNGRAIGVIGMMTDSEEKKKKLQNNLEIYLELLEQVAEFISVKAFEYDENIRVAATLKSLDLVSEKMIQGVIIVSINGTITSINNSALVQLKIDHDVKGEEVSIFPTGDIIADQKEYHLKIENKEYTIVGEFVNIDSPIHEFSSLLVFSELNSITDKEKPVVNPMEITNIVGVSKEIVKLRQEIVKIANSKSTVLITGESGTGKEMVATAIWKASDRKDKPFIAVNCGAIPESLLESELFGYVKGAFTGADSKGRVGKFELANNGIIFLDEIGDMPLHFQVKLLRVLQERKIVRIGSNQVIPLNVRVIAATNKNLEEMVEKNEFREDLYYRLNVIPINVPSLKERPGDIQLLFEYFAWKYADINEKKYRGIEPAALNILKSYSWKGNVRELENAVEFMMNMMDDTGIIKIKDLPISIANSQKTAKADLENSVIALDVLEKREIEKALKLYGSSTQAKKQIADLLGVGIATLYRKIEKYGLNYQNDNRI